MGGGGSVGDGEVKEWGSGASRIAVSWAPEATRRKGQESRREDSACGLPVFPPKGVTVLECSGQLLSFLKGIREQ